MGRALGDCQAVSSQRAYSPVPTARHARYAELCYLAGNRMGARLWERPAARDQAIVRRPSMKEGGFTGVPEILCVPLRVRHNAWRRDRPHPVLGALPCSYGLRIINANGFVFFNDSSAAFRNLPFQAATSQIFVYAPLPNIAPKVSCTASTLTGLNPRSHRLEFIPC